MKTLENKVAIITGAGSGIGKATALLFAKEGAVVIVSDINKEQGLAVVHQIRKEHGQASFVKTDTSKPDENRNLVQEIIRLYGRIDIAVNNAGIGGPKGSTADLAIEDWRKVIEINLSGVFYGMKYQIQAMKGKGGSIVNVASGLGQVAQPSIPAYIAAKHGVVGLTKAAALDHAHENLRINSVGPGYIDTPLLSEMDKGMRDAITALHPIGRLGQANEVAELILWLASDKSSFATGSFYPVDGGYLAR